MGRVCWRKEDLRFDVAERVEEDLGYWERSSPRTAASSSDIPAL